MGDNDKSLCYIAKIYFDKNQLLNAQKYLWLNLKEFGNKKYYKQLQKLTLEELKNY